MTAIHNPTLQAEARRLNFLKRWVKRILWAFIVLLSVLVLCGAFYQLAAEHRDRQRFPQSGRSVDVGGFSLNIHCTGQGSPTVILDSGLGVPAIGWDLVQPDAAKFACVCSYDRAGYGWSAPGPFPRTSVEIAKELHTLLERSRIPPPYILVGHSFGGYNVRVFNGLYPGEVVGMVLVDSSHEDQEARMPASFQAVMAKSDRQVRRIRPVMPLLIHLGIARAALNADPSLHLLPRDLSEEIVYLQLQLKFVDAIASELASFPESARETLDSGNLCDKPLIVLTAGRTQEVPGVPPQDLAAFQEIWIKELQASLARLSTDGRQVMVPQSDHLIPFEQPQTVVSAIREVWEATQSK
jgi:pimeloyl-ACP methyl ester carboxylesterase